MKSFWWFKENSIAGVGRPGFNAVHWNDLPFDEAVLMGWIGKYSSGAENLQSFREHLKTYAPRIYKFYGLDDAGGAKATEIFNSTDGISDALKRLASKTKIIESFSIENDILHFTLSRAHLHSEVEYLKGKGIRRLVSLTERHHHREELQEHFKLHHIGIEDLNAPTVEQAHELRRILEESSQRRETIAVHCLAGIGRTSTMLMAAHILMGHKPADVEELLKKQNPAFSLTGSQGQFLRSLNVER